MKSCSYLDDAITINAKGSIALCCMDFEYKIPLKDAKKMIEILEVPYINKNRHIIHIESIKWEIDEFLDKNGLTVDGVYFTNGELKIEKLLELGSSMHHDDDPDEINAAKENGITTVISDPYGDYSSLEKGNF